MISKGLKFDNRYAWVTMWDERGMMVQARAYPDSALVMAAIVVNEVGLFTYDDVTGAVVPQVEFSPEYLVSADSLDG
ncbi:hypothetical protein OEA41_010374 [Lepraria neglecta]|uniref:Uncharacterized protein n=1 Tax=Lepraria neglecta TaxID=209136 RepID=A0AAE0DHN1_9LECA|nr:hypothetical protein OEA41_010374 [Lepraria neglecta]